MEVLNKFGEARVRFLLQNPRFFKYIWSVYFVILSFVCQSPTGHNSKPIVMKLYEVVEVISTENSVDFEVKLKKKIIIFFSSN